MIAALRPARTTMWLPLAAALLPLWRASVTMPEFFQVDSGVPLSTGAPSVWSIVQAIPLFDTLPLVGLAMAAAIGVGGMLAAQWLLRPPAPSQSCAAALLVALVLPGLLPGVQPGDFLPALLCGLALAWARRDGTNIGIAALIVMGSIAAFAGLAAFGALTMIAATWLVARALIVSPANDNGLPLNPFRVYPA